MPSGAPFDDSSPTVTSCRRALVAKAAATMIPVTANASAPITQLHARTSRTLVSVSELEFDDSIPVDRRRPAASSCSTAATSAGVAPAGRSTWVTNPSASGRKSSRSIDPSTSTSSSSHSAARPEPTMVHVPAGFSRVRSSPTWRSEPVQQRRRQPRFVEGARSASRDRRSWPAWRRARRAARRRSDRPTVSIGRLPDTPLVIDASAGTWSADDEGVVEGSGAPRDRRSCPTAG